MALRQRSPAALRHRTAFPESAEEPHAGPDASNTEVRGRRSGRRDSLEEFPAVLLKRRPVRHLSACTWTSVSNTWDWPNACTGRTSVRRDRSLVSFSLNSPCVTRRWRGWRVRAPRDVRSAGGERHDTAGGTPRGPGTSSGATGGGTGRSDGEHRGVGTRDDARAAAPFRYGRAGGRGRTGTGRTRAPGTRPVRSRTTGPPRNPRAALHGPSGRRWCLNTGNLLRSRLKSTRCCIISSLRKPTCSR